MKGAEDSWGLLIRFFLYGKIWLSERGLWIEHTWERGDKVGHNGSCDEDLAKSFSIIMHNNFCYAIQVGYYKGSLSLSLSPSLS